MDHLKSIWFSPSLHPHVVQTIAAVGILAIGLVLITLFLRSLTLFALRRQLSPLMLRPLHYFIRWGGYVIIIALILSNFGIPVLTMVGTVVAMVALGFVAVWSVLTNISCALLLIIFQPFQIEDEIEFPGDPIKGRVVDLNFIFTTLETENGDLLQIPNSLFFQKTIRRRKAEQATTLKHRVSEKN
ncbi:MAG: mechanosensitive ion channel domain-containing protein [Chthoniobacterales bacterium]